jgi:DNA-binding LacI/PurR family transcriptional regulator
MSQIHTEKKTRLHLIIRDRILNMVIKSGSRRGDPLPSYREMTDRFDVSLVTVQRAMDELIKDGIVRGWPGRGTFLDRDLSTEGRRLTQVGIVINCSRKTFFSCAYLMELFQGVMLQCEELNVDARLFSIKNDGTLSPRQIAESGVDGVLLLAVHNDAYIQDVLLEHSPVVVVDHFSKDIATDFVICDTKPAMQEIVEHLVKLGHRHIGFVPTWTTDTIAGLQGLNPEIESPISIERRTEFMLAMAGAGLLGGAVTYDFPGEMQHMLPHVVARWKKEEPRPTALVTGSAGDAANLLREFAALGLSVPRDISLAAVAGTAGEAIAGSVLVAHNRVNFVEMGRKAVSILFERCGQLRPTTAQYWRIGGEFVPGATMGPAKGQ